MPHSTGERRILSTAEAHARFGVNQTYLSILAQQGKVEAFKIGYVWAIYEDSLMKYLATPHTPGRKKQGVTTS